MDVYKSWKVINCRDEHNLKDVEVGIKNKFNWSWLEKSLTLKVKIGSREEDVVVHGVDSIRKINKPGKCLCTWCDAEINYGGGGWPRIKDHLESKKHKEVTSSVILLQS